MSDLHRLNTLESLEMKGVYVNDYPGLVLDGKDISYFFLRFSWEDVFGPGTAAEKPDQGGGQFLSAVLKFIDARNSEAQTVGTDREIKVFYLDDQGYGLLGLVEGGTEQLRLRTKKREITGERAFQLNLVRVYAAEGIDGLYQVRNAEVKGVYDGLQKYIAAYRHGWLGLFRQYETIKERTEVFRRFKPFKFPIFGTKESLKKAVFLIQLGMRSTNGDEAFKRVSLGYGGVKLEDALAV